MSAVDSPFAIGDVVLTDEGRVGIYEGDGRGTYGAVLFLDDVEPRHLALPWSALEAPSGLWRCFCPRYWKVATAPSLHCHKCGAIRLIPQGAAA